MPPRRGHSQGRERAEPPGGLWAEASLSQALEAEQGPRRAPWGGQPWPRNLGGSESVEVGKARSGVVLEKPLGPREGFSLVCRQGQGHPGSVLSSTAAFC